MATLQSCPTMPSRGLTCYACASARTVPGTSCGEPRRWSLLVARAVPSAVSRWTPAGTSARKPPSTDYAQHMPDAGANADHAGFDPGLRIDWLEAARLAGGGRGNLGLTILPGK